MYYVCSIYRIAIYVGILCMNTTMKTKLYISLYVYIYTKYMYIQIKYISLYIYTYKNTKQHTYINIYIKRIHKQNK